jgi:hypothetical protein
LLTGNPEWGFFGTMRHHADPNEAWKLAFAAIMQATGSDPVAVRAFLDSPHGERFADEAVMPMHEGRPLPDAIAAAVDRWMGLPYLVGCVLGTGVPEDFRGELFTIGPDGRPTDAALHEEILAGGDEDAATEVSRQLAREEGWDEETIARLYGPGRRGQTDDL